MSFLYRLIGPSVCAFRGGGSLSGLICFQLSAKKTHMFSVDGKRDAAKQVVRFVSWAGRSALAVVYFMSDASGDVARTQITVDGGWTAW